VQSIYRSSTGLHAMKWYWPSRNEAALAFMQWSGTTGLHAMKWYWPSRNAAQW